MGDAHDAALRELGWWHLFTGKDARRVLVEWRGNVRDWLAFRDYSLAASHPHELAVYRTLLEMDYDLHSDGKHLPMWLEQLEATEHPAEDGRKEQLREQRRNELARSVGGWLTRLQGEAPTLKRIQETKERVAAYEAARDAARQTLDKSVYLASLKTQALVPSYVKREDGPAASAEEWALPKRMVIPEHRDIAQRHARGCVAEASLANFFNANHGAFWKLSDEGRQEFLVTYHMGKGPAGHHLDVLAGWIDDNMPVFQKYGWDWREVSEAAVERSLPQPSDFVKWASGRKRGWSLKSKDPKAMKQTRHLLTPRPRIATVSNSES